MSPARMPGSPFMSNRIVTFYSYKGGTGRSMVLANLAWILASSGRRVLAVDWDLEAPGLHRYFHPFLLDPEMATTDGVIDFVARFVSHAVAGAAGDPVRPDAGSGLDPGLADLTEFAVRLEHKFPDGGLLDLVGAGRQTPGYAAKVNSFDWQTFYDRLGGGAFLQSMRALVREAYDVVLIDSRTGVSDTAGLCTVELPDSLVVCFTLNSQSIEGAAAVANSVRAQRSADSLTILPVPMRVEPAEKVRLERARDLARQRFDPLLLDLTDRDRDEYWGTVEVMYEPFYAYEEVLAVFGDRPHRTNSVLAAVERITDRITDGAVTALPALPEDRRLELLERYTRRSASSSPSRSASLLPGVYLSSSTRARSLSKRLAETLTATGTLYRIANPGDVPVGSNVEEHLEQAITEASLVLALVTPDVDRSLNFARQEWDLAKVLGKPILPVLADSHTRLPPVLADRPAIIVPFDGNAEEYRLSVSRLSNAIEALLADHGSAASTGIRTVTVSLRADRVRLVSDLDDVEAPHRLAGLELRTIQALAGLMPSKPADPPGSMSSGDSEPGRILGQLLYQGLLTGRVSVMLEQLLEESARETARPLRLHLEFDSTSDDLRALPWELLVGPPGPSAQYLASRNDVRLTMGVAETVAVKPAEPGPGPMTVLIFNPVDDRAITMMAMTQTPSTRLLIEPEVSLVAKELMLAKNQIVHIVGHFAHSRAEWLVHAATVAGPSESGFGARLIILEDRDVGDRTVHRIAQEVLGVLAGAVLVVSTVSLNTSHRFVSALYESLGRGSRIDDAVSFARLGSVSPFDGLAAPVVTLYTSVDPKPIVIAPADPLPGTDPG